MTSKRKNGIDLFCGLGGFSFGMKSAGYTPIVGVDKWDIAVEIYQKNFPNAKAIAGDLFDPAFSKEFVRTWKGKADLVTGGPPCQAWSILNRKTQGGGDTGPETFMKIAVALNPNIIVMENVRQVAQNERTMDAIHETLQKAKYKVEHGILDSKYFGVPQSRKRLYIVAYKQRMYKGSILDDLSKQDFVPINSKLKRPDKHHKVSEHAISMIGKDTKWKNSYTVLDETGVSPAVTRMFQDPLCWPMRKYRGHYYRVSKQDAMILQGVEGSALPAKKTDARILIGNAVVPNIIKQILRQLETPAKERIRETVKHPAGRIFGNRLILKG